MYKIFLLISPCKALVRGADWLPPERQDPRQLKSSQEYRSIDLLRIGLYNVDFEEDEAFKGQVCHPFTERRTLTFSRLQI